MKKSDLKTGMILKFSNGELGMVLLGTADGDIISGETWFPLENHTDEELFGHSDIYGLVVTVYQPKAPRDYLSGGIELNNEYRVLWERPKEMTIKQIEEELGYPVKIVGMQS